MSSLSVTRHKQQGAGVRGKVFETFKRFFLFEVRALRLPNLATLGGGGGAGVFGRYLQEGCCEIV
jgi:hypothetical protein